jgi:hypothetical protein
MEISKASRLEARPSEQQIVGLMMQRLGETLDLYITSLGTGYNKAASIMISQDKYDTRIRTGVSHPLARLNALGVGTGNISFIRDDKSSHLSEYAKLFGIDTRFRIVVDFHTDRLSLDEAKEAVTSKDGEEIVILPNKFPDTFSAEPAWGIAIPKSSLNMSPERMNTTLLVGENNREAKVIRHPKEVAVEGEVIKDEGEIMVTKTDVTGSDYEAMIYILGYLTDQVTKLTEEKLTEAA